MIESIVIASYAVGVVAMLLRLIHRLNVTADDSRATWAGAYLGCAFLAPLWPVIVIDWTLNRFVLPRDSETL